MFVLHGKSFGGCSQTIIVLLDYLSRPLKRATLPGVPVPTHRDCAKENQAFGCALPIEHPSRDARAGTPLVGLLPRLRAAVLHPAVCLLPSAFCRLPSAFSPASTVFPKALHNRSVRTATRETPHLDQPCSHRPLVATARFCLRIAGRHGRASCGAQYLSASVRLRLQAFLSSFTRPLTQAVLTSSFSIAKRDKENRHKHRHGRHEQNKYRQVKVLCECLRYRGATHGALSQRGVRHRERA